MALVPNDQIVVHIICHHDAQHEAILFHEHFLAAIYRTLQ
jgi:hypothetical protein